MARASTLPVFLLLLAGCGPTPATITGRGSTFLEPLMKVWIADYRETHSDLHIDYTGSGSADGVAKLCDGLTDFGCTDVPLTRNQLKALRERGIPLMQIPVVAGAVVPIYNLPGIDHPITFSGPVLAAIYLGRVTHWNDPSLVALNPGITLPSLGIQPVVRSDPSGTTALFTAYLAKTDGDFKREVGAGSDPRWPARLGTRQHRSSGVAGHVLRTPGALGYVELTFALDTRQQYGALVNKHGRDVLADLVSISKTLEDDRLFKFCGFTTDEETLAIMIESITLDKLEDYPMTSLTYLILPSEGDTESRRLTVEFLNWVLSPQGQSWARRRNYAPLPERILVWARIVLKPISPKP